MVLELTDEPGEQKRCPKCDTPFSEWFVWGGLLYCFPCWIDSGFKFVWTEDLDGRGPIHS